VCEANTWNASFDQLVAAGIPVIRDTDGGTGSALMHDKYIVRDGTAVLTGSYNWTATQTTADKNTVIIVTNAAELAGLYQQDFTQMFVYKRFGNQKQAVSSTTCQVDGYSVEVYFSPKTRPEPALVSAIGTANSNLYFSVFTFTSTPVADAIAARDSAGVSCRGVFDNWQASGAYSRDEALRAAGVEVRADTWSGFLHDKIMAIDGATTSDPIGVVGSYNWTASANSSNDENVLIMHYPAVANSIRANVINTYNKYAR
jgi:phosphatidylserine/phosphatidylglycerophosphate/cardiolipin synthase-like enzyme